MFKGMLTKEVYEQCLTIGLCDKHIRKLDSELNFNDRHELQRKAFLYIRLRILDPILFGKPFIFEKMKTLVSKSDYFSMCNQHFDEMNDKTSFIEKVILLDSIVVFTLSHFSKVCCSGYLFRNEDEIVSFCSPEDNSIQKLLSSKNVTESDISHFNPILQNNFKGYDKNFIKFCYVIALLFVRTTAVKVKFKDALTELSADLRIISEECSNLLEKAKEAESKKNYVEAIKSCSAALKYNPYSVVGLSHRAAIYLNINELKPAQLDSYISVIIDPFLIQGYKTLILSLGHQYSFEDSYQTLQYALSKCKADVEEYEELLEIETLMKENQKQQEICNSTYKFNDEKIKEKLNETELEDVPHLSDASKSDDDNYGEDTRGETKCEEICSHLKEGSQSLLNGCGTLAIRQFQEVMNTIKNDTVSNFEECDKVVFNYAFGLAYCSSGSHDDLLKSINLFKEVIEDHSAVTFPAAYYGIGLAYYKLNRFKDSLKYLKIVEDILEKGIHFKVYTWPGLSDIIKETKPDYLKILVENMIKDCEAAPSPDAVCRFEKCTLQPSIYYKDPKFKGFFTLHCSEQCLLQYHPLCWKTFKNINRYSDKEFLEKGCFTPDCVGIIVKVENINKEGNTEKMFEIPQAKKSAKQKKIKIFKKNYVKEEKRKQQNSKDLDADKLNNLLKTSSIGDIVKEATVDSNEKNFEIKKSGNANIFTSSLSGKDETPVIIKKENTNENCQTAKVKGGKKVKAHAISFSEFYNISDDHSRAERGTLGELCNSTQVSNQCTDMEEFSDKIEDFEAVKNNLYNYLEDFFIKNGPLSIKDAQLIAEIETFPTEANIVIAKFGGIEEFLKRDTEHRFGIVDDLYLCSRVNLAEAYKLSRNSIIDSAIIFEESMGRQICELNPDAQEYTPTSSTSASTISKSEDYFSNIEIKKCHSSFIPAIPTQPLTETTQPFKNSFKSNKGLQTEQPFTKSVGTMKTDDELKRLNDMVDLIKKEKQDVIIEKTLIETKLASEIKSALMQHKEATFEIGCLKKELQDSNSIIESKTKEHKKIEMNLELENNRLADLLKKINEENIQLKKEIDQLCSSNESLLESLKNVETSFENLKAEKQMLRKTLDQKIENVAKLDNELTKRTQNAELQLLKFKKEVFFKKIDDKILEATQRIKEIEMCFPVINSNSLYKSNLEALIKEIHRYITTLKKIRLDLQNSIDEQMNSIKNGVLLETLNPIEMRNLPEIPSFTAQLLPTNNTASIHQSQLWNSQISSQAINITYPEMQTEISSGAKKNSLFMTEQTTDNNQCQKMLSNTPQIKNCENSKISYQNVPLCNLNEPETISTLIKSPLTTNVSKEPSKSDALCDLMESSNELRTKQESSTDKAFKIVEETSLSSAVSSNPGAICKDLLQSSSSTVEVKKSCDNLSLELDYSVKKKKDLEKSQLQVKSGNSYEKLLQKLKSKYPQKEESQLLKYIKEFRAKRKGGLSGLSIENIVTNVGTLIDFDSAQTKKEETSSKNRTLQSKKLINKKMTSEVKEEKISPVQRLCPWGYTTTNSENKWAGTNLDEGCIICYEDMSPLNCYKVDCGHCFHLKCIREWLNKKSDCPICRVHLLLPEDYPVL